MFTHEEAERLAYLSGDTRAASLLAEAARMEEVSGLSGDADSVLHNLPTSDHEEADALCDQLGGLIEELSKDGGASAEERADIAARMESELRELRQALSRAEQSVLECATDLRELSGKLVALDL